MEPSQPIKRPDKSPQHTVVLSQSTRQDNNPPAHSAPRRLRSQTSIIKDEQNNTVLDNITPELIMQDLLSTKKKESRPESKSNLDDNMIDVKRRGNKRKVVGGDKRLIQAQVDTLYENVKTIERTKTQEDIDFLKNKMKNHFVFYSLDDEMLETIVKEMFYCYVEKGSNVFEQGDNASSYFIIETGTVEILIDAQVKRTLKKGDSFGDLALLYNAPRSGTALCSEKTLLWGLHRNLFRSILQKMTTQQYAQNRIFIEQIPFFQNMTSEQRDAIAAELIKEKFPKDEPIVNEGDQANSFYIILEGRVRVVKGGQFIRHLHKGDSFGESALFAKTTRTMSVVADEDCICLALARDTLKSVLGDSVQMIAFRNVQKWAFEKSAILKGLTPVQIQKVIDKSKILMKKANEVIFAKGTPKSAKLVTVIEGNIIKATDPEQIFLPRGICYGEGAILNVMIENLYEDDYVMEKDGIIAEISRDDFEETIGGPLSVILKKNENSHEKRYTQVIKAKEKEIPEIPMSELIFIKKLGAGQFGCVNLVSYKDHLYALKNVARAKIQEFAIEIHIKQERKVLSIIDFPFIMNFVRTYKDEKNIYFLMEYINGMELFDVIRDIEGVLNTQDSQFYISQLLLGIEYLHRQGIIYRDIKPENIMIDDKGYMKLVDMGTAKFLDKEIGNRTFTLIGTPHYMAPEIFKGKGYSFPADLWSIGVCLYEFMCGMVPFGEDAEDPFEVYELVQNAELKFPPYVKDQKSRDMMRLLLNKAPEARSSDGFAGIKANDWFSGFDWEKLYAKELVPPYIPPADRLLAPDEVEDALKNPEPVIHQVERDNKHIKVRAFKLAQPKDPNWDEEFQ